MAALGFPEILKRHQMQLLVVSTDDVTPGAVVDKERKGYAPQGYVQDVLTGQPASFWQTELNQANLVYGTIQRSFALGGKASLTEMGVNIEGGLAKARSASLASTGVYARTLKNGPGHASMFSLTPLIHALKEQDRARWRLINGKWIVLETFYASEATVSFETAGNVNLRGEVDTAGGVSVSGGGNVTWTSKRAFTITGNNKAPFAFRGWKV